LSAGPCTIETLPSPRSLAIGHHLEPPELSSHTSDVIAPPDLGIESNFQLGPASEKLADPLLTNPFTEHSRPSRRDGPLFK